MSARDELAAMRGELQDLVGDAAERDDDDWFMDAANSILAAGYRKPRTVTTVEELDALPVWSVVRSEQATIWEKFHGFWAETMTLGRHPSDHIALPATVLFEGEA
jgi:hypothetical protein